MLRSLNVTMIKSLTLLQGLRLLQPSKSPRCVRKCTRDIRKKKSCWQVARGADYKGMKIHSVRLPGYVASQEVIFGSQGETLRISNEPVNRECYMPGVMLGCRKMMDKVGLTYGLDKLL